MTSLSQLPEFSEGSCSVSNEKSERGAAKYWILIATVVIGFVVWRSMPPQAVALAKDSIRTQLKDPASAQFQYVKQCPANSNMVEGDVNAKNSFGAYTGFKHFYAVNGFSYLSDSLTPLTNNGKTYSYAYQLSLACYKGADPDLENFHRAVAAGTAIAVP